jgi:hypothetical protein
VAVGVAEQDVEGELLGEVAEFLAVGRADQLAQARPQIRAGLLAGQVGLQAAAAGAALVVPGQFEFDGRLGLTGLGQFGGQPGVAGVERVDALLARHGGLVGGQAGFVVMEHGGGGIDGGVEGLQGLAFGAQPVGRVGQGGAQLGQIQHRALGCVEISKPVVQALRRLPAASCRAACRLRAWPRASSWRARWASAAWVAPWHRRGPRRPGPGRR